MRTRRTASWSVVILVLAGCSQSAPTTSPVEQSWNQEIAINPAVTVGTLDNGITYYVQKNTRPGGRAQLRLVVNAGSLAEEPHQSGGAHFLEHMMFNGTERYPSTELVKVLEGFGMQMGPDINAYTSYDETVYQLDLPTGDRGQLKEGLVVLREWAAEATIDEAEVEAERGVIVEEWRERTESLGGRISDAFNRLVLAGTPYEGKDPIGDIATVQQIEASELRAFYEEWYRPDLMAVVAVGDFDEGWMVDSIREVFADLPPHDSPANLPDGTIVRPESMRVVTMADPDASLAQVEIGFLNPWSASKTAEDQRASFATQLGLMVIDRRLEDGIARGEVPAMSVFTSLPGNIFRNGSWSGISLDVEPSEVAGGLAALATEVERALRHGIGESELKRQIEVLRGWETDAYRQRDTTQDWDYADRYASHFLGYDPAPDAESRYALAEMIFEAVTLEEVEASLRNVLSGSPLVLVVAPTSVGVPSEAEVKAWWQEIQQSEIPAWVDISSDRTTLMEPPKEVTPVSITDVDESRATQLKYSNGIRVILLDTDIHQGFVTMLATSPGGQSVYEEGDVVEAAIIPEIVSRSGIADIDRPALDRILAGKSVSVTPYVGIVDEGFEGEAAADDLELMFQLLHLYMSEPRVDEVQARNVVNEWRPYVENPLATPTLAAEMARANARYGDNPWYEPIPSRELFDDFDLSRAIQIFDERFVGAGDFLFVFVGDFDQSDARMLASRYLGSLRTLRVSEAVTDRLPDPPTVPITERVATGTGHQAAVTLSYSALFDHDATDRLLLEVLKVALENRLKDRLREELGATYWATVDMTVFDFPRPGVDVVIEIGNDPDRVDEVGAETRAVIDDLVSAGIGETERDTAVTQLMSDLELFSNPSLAEALLEADARDESFLDFVGRGETLAEFRDWSRLNDLIKKVFSGGYIEIQRVPAGS